MDNTEVGNLVPRRLPERSLLDTSLSDVRYINSALNSPSPYFFVFFFSPSSSPVFFLFPATLVLFLVPSAGFFSTFFALAPVFFSSAGFVGFAAFAFFAVFAFGFSSSSSSSSSSLSSTSSSASSLSSTSSLSLVDPGSSPSSASFSSICFLLEDFCCGAPFFGSFLVPGSFSYSPPRFSYSLESFVAWMSN
jgi:hypothetical protein